MPEREPDFTIEVLNDAFQLPSPKVARQQELWDLLLVLGLLLFGFVDPDPIWEVEDLRQDDGAKAFGVRRADQSRSATGQDTARPRSLRQMSASPRCGDGSRING
jgi:hypothetical protein